MKDEEINKAVAIALGWKVNRLGNLEYMHMDCNDGMVPPNYVNDLNACREMERHLTMNEAMEYERCLESLVSDAFAENDQYSVSFLALHASAAQRCEAFLRTLGLWEDNTTPEAPPQ